MINQLKKKNRLETIAEIRKQMTLDEDMPLRTKMNALEAFHLKHPEYAVRLLADAYGIKPATLDHHLRLNKRENSQYVRRRDALIPPILDYVHQYKYRPGINTITRRLNADGHRCSRTIVGAIVKDLRKRFLI